MLWMSGTADNEAGAEGARALASALGPRQNADGSWVTGTALKVLWLGGALRAADGQLDVS